MRALTDAGYFVAALLTSPLWLWWLFRTGQQRTDWRARFGFGVDLPTTNAGSKTATQTATQTTTRGRILVHARVAANQRRTKVRGCL